MKFMLRRYRKAIALTVVVIVVSLYFSITNTTNSGQGSQSFVGIVSITDGFYFLNGYRDYACFHTVPKCLILVENQTYHLIFPANSSSLPIDGELIEVTGPLVTTSIFWVVAPGGDIYVRSWSVDVSS